MQIYSVHVSSPQILSELKFSRKFSTFFFTTEFINKIPISSSNIDMWLYYWPNRHPLFITLLSQHVTSKGKYGLLLYDILGFWKVASFWNKNKVQNLSLGNGGSSIWTFHSKHTKQKHFIVSIQFLTWIYVLACHSYA